jgi:hypothetical protein
MESGNPFAHSSRAGLAEEELDDGHISPPAVEAAMSEVQANITKPAPGNQAAAGLVVGEEPANHLVTTGLLGCVLERHRQRGADAAASLGRSNVDARLGNPGITSARAVGRKSCPPHWGAVALSEEHQTVRRPEPVLEVRGAAGLGFERGAPLRYSLVVDGGDRCAILATRASDL